MKKILFSLLFAAPALVTAEIKHELPRRVAPDHIGHGNHHVPPGHEHQPHRVGGPRPGDPGFGYHTPPNRHTRGEGNDHDMTHHQLEHHFDEEIFKLHEEAREIEHKHGHESNEFHDHDLKIHKLRNRRRAINFLQRGMSDEEYDHLVSLYDELSELQHKPHVRHEEMEHVHTSDADLMARHEEQTKHEAVQKQIREIEEHYQQVPFTGKNVGTAKERKEMRDLYDLIHATHDKATRKKLKEQYKTKLKHLHDDQYRHPGMLEDDIAKIKELRAELHASDDEYERDEIQAEIEDIYRVHRHKKKLHRRNPHHPNNLDQNREINDEVLIELRQKMFQAQTKEERQTIKEQVRDRIHELHYGHVDEDIRPKRGNKKDRNKKSRLPQEKLKGAEIPKASLDLDSD